MVRKNIVEGQYVTEGEAMFEIADLSHVWVQAQIYEDQVASFASGRRSRPPGILPRRGLPGKGRFHRPGTQPDHPDRQRPLRPAQPRATASARDVRDRDPEDPGGRHPGLSDPVRGGSFLRRPGSARQHDGGGAENLPGDQGEAGLHGRPDCGRSGAEEGLGLLPRLPTQVQGRTGQVPGRALSADSANGGS